MVTKCSRRLALGAVLMFVATRKSAIGAGRARVHKEEVFVLQHPCRGDLLPFTFSTLWKPSGRCAGKGGELGKSDCGWY